MATYFANATFNGGTQIGHNTAPITITNLAPSSLSAEVDVSRNSEFPGPGPRIFVFVAKGHEEDGLIEALKICDWSQSPDATTVPGRFHSWSKSEQGRLSIYVDVFSVGAVGSAAVDYVTEEVTQGHTIFTTVGCCGGLPELPLRTAVPILSASLVDSIIPEPPSRIDFKGLDNITEQFKVAGKGGMRAPLVRTGSADGRIVNCQEEYQDDLLKFPKVLTTTTDFDAAGGTTDLCKSELDAKLRGKGCAVIEMEIGLYWQKLCSMSRQAEFTILPAFKGVSDNGYPDNLRDPMTGKRLSSIERENNRKAATCNASVVLLMYISRRF